MLSGIPNPSSTVGEIKHETPLENLKVCPANPSKDLPHQSVTIGDIHGNALRLIYQLIQAGVFESNHEYYQDLVTAYNALLSAPEEKSSEEEFSPEENNFLNVMNKFKICENPPFIRLIGDIFQDRGASDRMTNKVLEKLITEEVPYSINFSNHDMDFMIDYTNKQYNEKKDKSLSSNVFYKKPMTLLERDLFQSTWLKKLKLFDYEISEDGKQFYFFTHAPVGLETLKKISAQYGVEFNDESFSSLAKTIDSVNKKFQEEVTNEESRIRFIERIKKNKVFGSDDYHQDPIWQLCWNRSDDISIQWSFDKSPLQIIPVFGHTGEYDFNMIHPFLVNYVESLREKIGSLDINNYAKYDDTQKRIIDAIRIFINSISSKDIEENSFLLLEQIKILRASFLEIAPDETRAIWDSKANFNFLKMINYFTHKMKDIHIDLREGDEELLEHIDIWTNNLYFASVSPCQDIRCLDTNFAKSELEIHTHGNLRTLNTWDWFRGIEEDARYPLMHFLELLEKTDSKDKADTLRETTKSILQSYEAVKLAPNDEAKKEEFNHLCGNFSTQLMDLYTFSHARNQQLKIVLVGCALIGTLVGGLIGLGIDIFAQGSTLGAGTALGVIKGHAMGIALGAALMGITVGAGLKIYHNQFAFFGLKEKEAGENLANTLKSGLQR